MIQTKPATYLQELDQLPPFKCWALARKPGRRPITQHEIASVTGWGIVKVRRVCSLTTWASVSVVDADTFRSACGITRKNERYHKWYLKRTLDLTKVAAGLSHFRKRPGRASKKLIEISLTSLCSHPT